ncbi:hypothetical protein PARMER_04176 [Parabacteroides merdae ATCC 43184]|nr:hypothetical protein PARMER_04176 [Parabacteroides merdae ATCC 43184]
MKHEYKYDQSPRPFVVPYIGTWIETWKRVGRSKA